MTFNEYKELAMRTAGKGFNPVEELAVGGLGIAGEAGEVADYLKKVIGHGHSMEVEKLKKELGDVLWYVAYLCHLLKISMDDVAQLNIDKLKARYPNGFESERSINRKED